MQVEGYAFRPDESESAGFNAAAPGYFATIGTRLLSGREFDDRDTPAALEGRDRQPGVRAVFLRRGISTRPACDLGGHHLRDRGGGRRREIPNPSRRHAEDDIYIASTQREGESPDSYAYAARVAVGNPDRLVPAVERLVREIDPALRVYRAVSYATASTEQSRPSA